ncbi:MAG: ribosome biogenesis GTP-binding protein YihA/YsxC [Clostridiales bacterium]|nr:ribosome biogenesis GTP-binding protein YihA/YsxC [Clostridiales bacterium]
MNYSSIQYEASYGTAAQLPQSDLPEIAFSGRSNVGKSSLINKLFGRKNLARVSSAPGKTTTVNFFRCGDVRFADLPGYGYAKRSAAEIERWADLMEGYFQSQRNISLVVQLIDMRHAPSKDDVTMIKFMLDADVPFIIVLTKCDKLNKSQREKRRAELEHELAFAGECKKIEFSALTSEGCDNVKKAIDEKFQ